MAGAYQEIPIGRDYSFTTNVASRLADLGATMVNATLYFMAKASPGVDSDSDAILNITPTANTSTNVVTVTVSRANTNVAQIYPSLFWELSMLTSANKYYTLDQGRMAITQPVRDTVP